MLKEFKAFAVKGNVIDMAVGIIIGAAFGAIVKSLVDDVIMPPIGLLIGNVDFANLFITLKDGSLAGPYASVAEAKKAGAVTLNYGLFINSVVSFTIVAFAVFMLVKVVMRLKSKIESEEVAAEPTTKECPYCCSQVAIKAVKCPNCTSPLDA